MFSDISDRIKMHAFLLDTLAETTQQLYTRMLATYEAARIKKVNALTQEINPLKQLLTAELYGYIHEKTAKFDELTKLPIGKHKVNFALNISHGHEQYFSHSPQDLLALYIYENCLDMINKITDLTTAKEALNHLRRAAWGRFSHVANTLRHLVEILEKHLDECEPFGIGNRKNSFTQDILGKKIVSPQQEMIQKFLYMMNDKIEQDYNLLIQQYPSLREYINLIPQMEPLKNAINYLNSQIWDNVEAAKQCLINDNLDRDPWVIEIDTSNRAARDLYQKGLENKIKKEELETLKMSYELKLQTSSFGIPPSTINAAREIASVFQESSRGFGIFLNLRFCFGESISWGYYQDRKIHLDNNGNSGLYGMYTDVILSVGGECTYKAIYSSNFEKGDLCYSGKTYISNVFNYFSADDLKQFKNNMLNFISQKEKKLFPVSLQVSLPKENQEIDSRYLRKIGLFGHKDDIALPPQMIESPFAENVMYEL